MQKVSAAEAARALGVPYGTFIGRLNRNDMETGHWRREKHQRRYLTLLDAQELMAWPQYTARKSTPTAQ